jgi:hypothetical protein
VDVVDDPGGLFCGADRARTVAVALMRPTFAIAAIPLPVFGFAWILKPLPEKPIVPTPVIAEGVRKVDMDARTFAIRWSPVSYLAPAVMIQPVVEERISEPLMANAPQPQPRTIRRASLDVCARHRMRKVWYGKRWRCTRS